MGAYGCMLQSGLSCGPSDGQTQLRLLAQPFEVLPPSEEFDTYVIFILILFGGGAVTLPRCFLSCLIRVCCAPLQCQCQGPLCS